MTVDVNDPRPAWQQVAGDLQSKIEVGDYAPGARLPSVRQLAASYSVSPQTAQRAIRELANDGLVVSQQGRAAFVRDPDRPLHQVPDVPELAKRLDAVETELRELRSLVERLGAAQ
jgi:DNA-binding GntR family transcriptional regulator